MKILFFTPYYYPEPEAAAIRSYWFVQSLSMDKHQVEIISNSDFKFKLASNKAHTLIRLLKEHLSGLELFFRIIFSSKDLYLLSSPPFFTVLWGALACIIKRSKYILDVRDLYPEAYFEMKLIKKDSALGKMAQLITKFFYQKAHYIITVTHGLVREIKTYDANRVELIMNGYDSKLFYPGSAEEKFSKFSLIFHGNLGKVQNVETLLKLADELKGHKDIEIIVAGEGPKKKNILDANKENIKFLGSMPYEEIPKLLRKCHVGLSFRTDDKIGKEAFPVKVFEYIGTGIPVIMSPTGEAGDLVEKEGFGHQFDNQQIHEMVQKILEIKKNPPKISFDDKLSRQNSSKKILPLIRFN